MKKMLVFLVTFMAAFGLLGVLSSDIHTYAEVMTAPISEDEVVLPDKYNTGVYDESSLAVGTSGSYGEIKLFNSGDTALKFDFTQYPNLSGVIYICNYDFSSKGIRVYNAERLTQKLTIVFENCNFGAFSGPYWAEHRC